jgi:hypothetical protein
VVCRYSNEALLAVALDDEEQLARRRERARGEPSQSVERGAAPFAWKASAVAWRMSPAPRRVKSVAGGRDVEADGCGHDEDGGAEFCD